MAAQVFIHPVLRAIALHFWLAYDHRVKVILRQDPLKGRSAAVWSQSAEILGSTWMNQ